jgi:putative PIN family toxin of toxin-antitoxin system
VKVVLDTNILVSAMLSTRGRPALVVEAALDGRFAVCYNDIILAEYREVLARPHFRFDSKRVYLVIGGLVERGLEINPVPSDIPFIDETDRIFYDTAKNSGSLLVTGNQKHYPQEDFVVTAAHFLDKLSEP